MNHKIPIAKPNFGREEEEALKAVLESGILVQGERTQSFEKEFIFFSYLSLTPFTISSFFIILLRKWKIKNQVIIKKTIIFPFFVSFFVNI